MKASLYFLSFLLLGACGKYEYQGEFIGKSLSEVKIDPYSRTDSDSLVLACSALEHKENSLNSSGSEINSGIRMRFNVRVTSCSGQFTDTLQEVRIEKENDSYVFKQNSFENFVFKNVETPRVGVLAKVCQSVSTFSGQYDEGDKVVVVRTAETGTECPRASGSVCVQLIKVQKDSGKILSRELMRVRHSRTERFPGFFDWRRLSGTSIECGEGQFTTIEASLAN